MASDTASPDSTERRRSRRCSRAAVGCVLAWACLSAPVATAQDEPALTLTEASRRVHVTFDRGLAHVETTVRVSSEHDERAEVALVVPIPYHGALERARFCIGSRCRDAVRDRSPDSLGTYALSLIAPRFGSRPITPIGQVSERGTVRAAPVSRGAPLDVTVSYTVPIEVHGGHAWLHLRLSEGVPSEVSAIGYGAAPRIEGADGPVTIDDGHDVMVTAELPRGQRLTSAWRTQCGARTCTRIWLASGASSSPRDVFLAVDASPSMGEVADGRTERTVAAVLAALPSGSTVRGAVFGREVDVRIDSPVAPTEVSPASLVAAPGSLGRRTAVAAVFDHAAQALAGSSAPLIVLVTDARILRLPPSSGLPVSLINVSDLDADSLTADVTARGGVTIELARALDASPPRPLEHLLGVLTAAPQFESVRMPGEPATPLLAGEARYWNGEGLHSPDVSGMPVRPRAPPRIVARGLRRMLEEELGIDRTWRLVAVDRRDFEAAARWAVGGASSYPRVLGAVQIDRRVSDVVLAGPCDPATARGRLSACGRPRRARVPRIRGCYAEVRGSLSREVIARLLGHTRPAVRACLAAARRGRREFEASFTYRLILGHQEVMRAAISDASPNVDEELRGCLLDRPISAIVVPPILHGGLVSVNYPMHTSGQPPPVAVELDPEVGSLIDEISVEAGSATP